MKKKSVKSSKNKNEFKDIEKWMRERRKFLKKLFWVVILIICLIIISNLYLKISGVGI